LHFLVASRSLVGAARVARSGGTMLRCLGRLGDARIIAQLRAGTRRNTGLSLRGPPCSARGGEWVGPGSRFAKETNHDHAGKHSEATRLVGIGGCRRPGGRAAATGANISPTPGAT